MLGWAETAQHPSVLENSHKTFQGSGTCQGWLLSPQHHLFASGRNYDMCLKACLFNASNVILSSFKIDSFEALTWGWFSMNIFIFLEWSQVFQLPSWLVQWIFLLSHHQMNFPGGWGGSSLKENYSSVTEVLNEDFENIWWLWGSQYFRYSVQNTVK